MLRLTLYDVRRNEAREISLRFVSVRGSPHVLYAATAPPDWATQAKESSFIHWSIGSREVLGTARLVDNSTELRDEVLSLYESIVGPDTVRRWFGSEIGCIAFDESPEAVPYYRAVEAMFDESAPKYDRAVLTNPFDLHLRAVALESLRNLYRPGDRIIELGCGTGLESIPLAEAGIQVVALDISSGMLNELERKAETAGVRDRIETYRVPISKGRNRERPRPSFLRWSVLALRSFELRTPPRQDSACPSSPREARRPNFSGSLESDMPFRDALVWTGDAARPRSGPTPILGSGRQVAVRGSCLSPFPWRSREDVFTILFVGTDRRHLRWRTPLRLRSSLRITSKIRLVCEGLRSNDTRCTVPPVSRGLLPARIESAIT